jgi:hypothetical protein
MRSSWRKWRLLTRRERRIFVEATLEIVRTTLGLRRRGFHRAGGGAFIRQPGQPDALHSGSTEDAIAIARMVDVAARHSPLRPNCLQRSVCLWRVLRRHGIGSEVRVGARPGPVGGPPAFHAWAEHNGVVLNDRPEVVSVFVAFGPGRRAVS